MGMDNDMALRVYVAGSFNNICTCREAGGHIRDMGVQVYVFCDEDSHAYAWSMALREEIQIDTLTPMTAVEHDIVYKIYRAHMDELMRADVVVIILPCGKSAHLEAGWVKGMGGKLLIYGEMHKGEFDAMYCMADLVTDNFEHVIIRIQEYAALKEVGKL